MSVNQQPLNIRNNNPGNLRFVGQEGASPGEGGFAKFETPQAGLDAMRAQIELDTQKRGLNLSQFLNKYAPPSENKTADYIKFVTQKTGLDPNAPVPPSAIPQLQLAMIEMEGGPRSLSYFNKEAATKVAQAPAQAPRTTAPEPRTTKPGVQVAAAFNPMELPASYTSALALNYLSDTDPEGVTMSKVNEMLADMMEDGGGAATRKTPGAAVLQQYAQSEQVDPFAIMRQAQEAQQPKRKAVPQMPQTPQMFAQGGPVGEMSGAQAIEVDGYANGGLIPRALAANRPKMTKTDYDWLQARQAEFNDYNTAAENYQKAVDAYNAKVERGEDPGEFTTPEPTAPGTTAEQFEAYQKAAQERAGRFYAARAAGLESLVNPQKYNLSGMSFSFAHGGVVHRQAGSPPTGEVADIAEQMTVGTIPTEGQTPVGQAFRNIGRDVVRGAQYLPYDLLGAPVDIINMGLTPFGLGSQRPVGGSEYLIEKARQAGIADQPTGSAAETATRIGMGFVNPAAVARQIPKGIAALEKGVESMTLPAFRQITGNPNATREEMMDFVLNQRNIMQAGAPAISRLPGGTFTTNPESSLAKMINRSAERAQASVLGDSEKATAAAEMFTKKAFDFYTKRAGSPLDELKQELIAGRIKLPKEMDKVFPKYLLESARKGDLSAMRDLERRYDEMLGIEQRKILAKDYSERESRYEASQELRQNITQGILAQFKQTPELISDDLLYKLTNKNPTEVRIRIKDNPEYFSTVIEPKITELINVEGETIAPSDLARFPSSTAAFQPGVMTANELEAAKRGQPILELTKTYPELFGYDIDLLAKQAGKMSTQELKDITFATFVSRASKLAAKEKGLMAQADTAAQAIKANKPVDPKLLSYGTSEFMALPDGFQWRKITDPDATIVQAAVIDNSIKGYANYGAYGPFNNGRKALEEGNVELYVLYDSKGMPVTNVELAKGLKSGKFSMRQAYGDGPLTGNVLPSNYLPQLKALINKIQPTDLPFGLSEKIRYIDAPEGFAKGGIVDKPLYDRAA